MPATTRAAWTDEVKGTPRPVPTIKTRSDMEQLQGRIDTLEMSGRGKTTRINNLNNQYKKLSDELREKNAEIRELKRKLENEGKVKAECAALKSREAHIEQERIRLREEKTRLEAEQTRLKKESIRERTALAAEKRKMDEDMKAAEEEIQMLRTALTNTGRDRTHFECHICLREFFHKGDRIARILKCGHTFCEMCLEEESKGHWLMLCMTCRAPAHLPNGVQGLTKNFKSMPP